MIPVIHLGAIDLPTWILILSVTLSLALIWVHKRARTWEVSGSHALDLSLLMMIGALIGGRLFHVLYEAPHYYLSNPFAVVQIWQGGFVFYGGLIGALVTGRQWCVNHDQNYWRWADFFAPIFAGCYIMGRIGCFLNGCCFGQACDLPWAVTFTHHADYGIEVIARHPTQLYAAFWEAGVLTFLLWRERKRKPDGSLFLIWIILHAVGRLIMEYFRADDRGTLPLGFSIGQWISVTLIAVAAYSLKRVSHSENRL